MARKWRGRRGGLLETSPSLRARARGHNHNVPKERRAAAGEGQLTAAAEVLAEDAGSLGLAASSAAARAWEAGVAPEATRGLISAALAFGGGQAPADGEPVRRDQDLAEAAEMLSADAGDMLAAGRRLIGDAERAAQDAAEALAAARGSNRPADEITEVSAWAARVLADCDTATEIAADLAGRLEWAIARLADVPGDLEATYESVYQLLASGGALPYAGDWLTPLLASPSAAIAAGTPSGGYQEP
jgi:hypothetical protein